MNVVPLRRKHYCRSCGISFVPLAPTHRLCLACWKWRKLGAYIAATRRLLEGAR